MTTMADQIQALARTPEPRRTAPSCPRQRDDALLLLVATRQALAEGGELPDSIRDWLADALDDYLHGAAPTLDQALQVAPGAGQLHPATQYRLQRRNAHLRAAWLLLPGDRWHRTLALSARVSRLTAGHPALDAVDDEIEAAIATGARIPATSRGLDLCIRS